MEDPTPSRIPFIVGGVILVILIIGGGTVALLGQQLRQATSPLVASETKALPTDFGLNRTPGDSANTPSVQLSTTAPTATTSKPSATSTSSNSTTVVSQTDAPTFTKVTETTVDGGNQWLFPINDGETKLAVSSEQGNSIVMGRLDLDHPDRTIEWKTVASSADTGGEGIADHWHIFAHDAHWIVFSVQQANRSFLVKLDKQFERMSLTPVANKDELTPEDIEALGIVSPPDDPMASKNKPVVTNDMYLIAESDGVAVSHFVPGVGSRIYRFTTDGQLRGTTLVGGGDYVHGNGSSAELGTNGFHIFASESLNVVAQGAVKLIETTTNWAPTSIKLLIDESKKNIAMPSSVLLSNGYRVVNARVVSGTYPRGEMPPPPQSGQNGMMADDSGAIVRYLFAPNGALAAREEITASKGNRPHTALVGDRLVTAWDTTGQLKLRIDTITGL